MPTINGFIEHQSSSKRGESKTLTGTTGPDIFYGLHGDDIFVGKGGQDIFWGGDGNDKIDFRWATTAIKIDLAQDQAQNTGGGGSVIVHYIHGLYGSNWADTVWGSNYNDWLSGQAGNDQLHGGAGWDTIFGDAGDDQLDGGTGNDSLNGGVGNDILSGGGDDDTLDGGAGADQLSGGVGADKLYGGEGNDLLNGGAGADLIDGGDGFDTLSYESSGPIVINVHDASSRYTGDAAGDTIRGIEAIILSNYDDNYIGSGVSWQVHGGSGNDHVTGSGGLDLFFGDDGNDVLQGLDENDTLHGGAGNDSLDGGTGTDLLFGEGGMDIFVFATGDSTNAHPDRIMDFSHAEKDRIDLSKIDAVAGGADNAFHFIGLGAFSGTAGELAITHADAATWKIMGDTNGDRIADFTILVVTSVQPVMGDFTL
jgi:Ca2+-binding RTX toxin-like protein